jgi:hypothetical protein
MCGMRKYDIRVYGASLCTVKSQRQITREILQVSLLPR